MYIETGGGAVRFFVLLLGRGWFLTPLGGPRYL